MASLEVKTRCWKRVEYERLIETGFFQPGDPVELVGGQLIVAEPQGSGHFAAARAVEEALRAAFGPAWEMRDYAFEHPSRPVLVVEVAESSLPLDRDYKGSLYARAGLADYWILNLVDRVLEVCRVPTPDPAAPFGWRYQSVEVLGREASVVPLVLPGGRIRVVDLLP